MSSASEKPVSQGENTAGVTTADRAAYAKSQMWKAWAEFTDWRRRFEQLERQASDELWGMVEAPAVSPDDKPETDRRG